MIMLLGCSKPDEMYYENYYTPILMKRDQLEKSIVFVPSKDIYQPGKIYFKDNYIFLNEKWKGIHIIDNSNPASPAKVGFIQIPGNVDIAIKGTTLFADNAVDLIAIDISNIQNLAVTCRIKDVFPELLPPDYQYMPYQFEKKNRPANTIIVEWKEIERKAN
jgi:hypothetical protein